MSENPIQVDHVSKMYKLYNKPSDRLKESLGLSRKKNYREHYALNDVSFQVEKGQTMGIIGTNGSGKSTLLKIITGVLNPTAGQVQVNGRISALLELGAGFNGEYSGVENVILNGTMNGFTREEINAKMDDILSFADIGDFVHQPVKTYSSGMFVRLAFAVAINIEPEILIVDEALSVGDVFFQSKCYRKFEEFRSMGKTLLLVSHDLSSISKYSDKVLLLNKGRLVEEGDPKHIVDLYKRYLVGQGETKQEEKSAEANKGTTAAGADASETAGNAQPNAAKADTNPLSSEDLADQSQDDGANPEVQTDSKNESRQWLNRKGFSTNMNMLEYGEKRAEIIDIAVIDENGVCTNVIAKGTEFSVMMKVRFCEEVRDPIMAFTIKDIKGTELTGTNTMYEGENMDVKQEGDVVTATFKQTMTLQGGNYLISFGCTGYRDADFHVYHRLYDACDLTVISTRDTVGYFDMNSTVTIEEE